MPDENDPAFENLLDYLRRNRGFDFTGYKRASLVRRVLKRMELCNVETFDNYLDYLQVRPQEFEALFNTILINVTAFFRDQEAWTYLRDQILRPRLRRLGSEQVFRVWSAGCASGEEAYSIAMVLGQELGEERLRNQVKIYATDVDEEALNQARQAVYSAKEVENLPSEYLDQFFDVTQDRYVFRSELRRAVIFGRHDLLQDAPISRLDLLLCRNTLMYFNSETQAHILNRFHFALKPDGVLFLGKAEMLLTYTELFTPINLQYRVFRGAGRPQWRNRALSVGSASEVSSSGKTTGQLRLCELALDALPLAILVVDVEGYLELANSRARTLFSLSEKDLGKPLQDLEVSYRPVELRSRIQRAYEIYEPVLVEDVMISTGNSVTYWDVEIQVLDLQGKDLSNGVSITFSDVTRNHELQTELHRSNQELETANEELQSTNEELETTNEELQSTNEELETINEELHSSNEELETTNEELQSTNEELHTINAELRQRTYDLNLVNAYLNSVLSSIRFSVIVVNHQLQVIGWNTQSEETWGLRQHEVMEEPFFGLDIGLPVTELRDLIMSCLEQREHPQLELEAVNRRGRTIHCQISCHPLIGPEEKQQGVILVLEPLES